MRKRIASALAILTMAAVALLAFASPAAAAAEKDYAVDVDWNNDYSKSCYTASDVSGCIQPTGDDIWVKDNDANGYDVAVMWDDLDGTRAGTCYDTLGAAKAWTMCNKDWTDGHRIQWYVGYEQVYGIWGWIGPFTTTI